jgi:hypothetical protein
MNDIAEGSPPAKGLRGIILVIVLLIGLIGIQLLNLLNFRTDGTFGPLLFLGRTILLLLTALLGTVSILGRSKTAFIWIAIASFSWVAWFLYIDYLNFKLNGHFTPELWVIYGAMAGICVLVLVYVRWRIKDGTLT